MKICVISDVHSNLVALEAVLADVPEVDALVNAGDIVGYNPWPAECVEAMQSPAKSPLVPDHLATAIQRSPTPGASGVPTVRGNHDQAVVKNAPFRFNQMAKAGVEHALGELNDLHTTWLSSLPTEWSLFDDRLKVVHGHPDDPNQYTYPDDFEPSLLGDEDVLVMGHTHVQHHEVYDEGIVMNPGSVGQPRDGDPRAAYAVVDLKDLTVEERRVEYDIERVQQAVSSAGLPAKIGSRLADGQ